MRTAASAADQFTVGLDGGERAISEKAAAGLFVRRVRLAREPALRELRGRVVDAILRRLPLEPRGELGHAVRELDLRHVAERLLRELHVGEAVADVADA